MFGIRTLIYLVGIGLVVWIFLRLSKKPRVESRPQQKVGNMVRCARCGTYLPHNEALQEGDKYYCCSAHRNEDR